jgi:hypothetical protein
MKSNEMGCYGSVFISSLPDHGVQREPAPLNATVPFGAHLPLMDFGGNRYLLGDLMAYARAARKLGFAAVSVNDHMVFAVPWLDGPTALAAVVEHTGEMTLATTVTLPVVRGPVAGHRCVIRSRAAFGRSARCVPIRSSR